MQHYEIDWTKSYLLFTSSGDIRLNKHIKKKINMANQKKFTATIEGKPSITDNGFKSVQSFDSFDSVVIWAFLFENWKMKIDEPAGPGFRHAFYGESHNLEILMNY